MLLALLMAFGATPFAGVDLFSVDAKAATISSYSNGDIIEFGWYPQSQVTDNNIINVLNADDGEWISYGYYSGTGTIHDGNMKAGNYMRYKDVIYGSNKYRGVVFDTYRQKRTGQVSTNSTDNADQYANGYTTSTVYWFKYEPIEWRVLDPDTGMVMSETILDSQAYNNYILSSNIAGTSDDDACWGNSSKTYYSNNYANSSIRTWLNENFYNTAFSSAQQSIIQYTKLDNSAYGGSSSIYSEYASQTTNDKIYLLSWEDVHRTEYGFIPDCDKEDTKRIAQGSDYAKCQGLHINKYSGKPSWYLRTAGHRSVYVCGVSLVGSSGTGFSTDYILYGIRPALNFNLSSEIFQSNVNNTNTYTISYNANGGSGAPVAQAKQHGVNLTLSNTIPTKRYSVSYNANSGSVSPSSKTVSCTFKNWNTAQNGSGTTYAPGSSYTVNSGALLYAQWSNPTYGTLPTPTKAGYTFDGWYTSASGGSKITGSTTVTSNTTIYAHWSKIPEADIYNLGEETYSFANFGDNDSPGGHCFGMSVTSAGYYTEELDITDVGGNYEQDVYALKRSTRVDAPICYYQPIQHSYSTNAMVAGGTNYKNRNKWDIASDWNEVINYVKNHSHDNKGDLQIGFRGKYDYYGTAKEGGHAINFLRYEEVNGQPRIYAYDNNFPDTETYFYKDSNGNIKQAPKATFDISIDCIALRSIPKYFDLAADYDSTRYIYAEKDSISIEGLDAYLMDGSTEMGSTVMFEVPAGVNQITIVPLVDNAEFEYLDESYSFGAVDVDTVGVFTLATSDDQGSGSSPSFTIENEGKSIWELIVDFFKMIFGFILLPFALLF